MINNHIYIILVVLFLRSDQVMCGQHYSSNRKNDTISSRRGIISLGAAIMLVPEDWSKGSRNDRQCNFNLSMTALSTLWHPNNKYPIILLNTRRWAPKEMLTIRKSWPLIDIMFLDITGVFRKLPNNITFEDHKNPLSDIAYKQMCTFFFKGITQVPLFRHFRYIMRLDEDSCLRNPINFDVFKEMKARDIHYAYQDTFNDPKEVTIGLNEYISSYMKKNNRKYANLILREHSLRSTDSFPSFSTNLEIIDMFRYTQPDIMNFIEAVDASRSIYHYRWGDAPLRHAIAQMFWTDEEVLRLCEFTYQHSSWAESSMCEHRNTINSFIKKR